MVRICDNLPAHQSSRIHEITGSFRVRECRFWSGYTFSEHAHSVVGIVLSIYGRFTASIDGAPFNVRWLEFSSKVPSSIAGPDEAGGAYWVAMHGGTVPHVLRYKNASVDIVWRGIL